MERRLAQPPPPLGPVLVVSRVVRRPGAAWLLEGGLTCMFVMWMGLVDRGVLVVTETGSAQGSWELGEAVETKFLE